MRRLQQILQDHDPGHLRIVADLWGLDAPTGPAAAAAETLAQEMVDERRLTEILESLRPEARAVLRTLLDGGGAAPLADLERRYGPIRPMGPARRDREKPWREPSSALEDLWYRGLLGRAFADTALGPQEFGFLPSDILSLLPVTALPSAPLGEPAASPRAARGAGFAALEDAATILAALRRRPGKIALGPHLIPLLSHPESAELILHLLVQLGCAKARPLQPEPERARRFLEAPRSSSWAELLLAWRDSPAWNELARLPHLQAPRSGWPNEPLPARRAILEFLRPIPVGTWWDLESFVSAVRDIHPGFQRPGGDFDAWYLRDRFTGVFLRGFESWDRIEGGLLRSVIAGPLFWLGAVELAADAGVAGRPVFRITQFARAIYEEVVSRDDTPAPRSGIRLTAEARITVPREAPLAHRYQISRVSTWLGRDEAGFHFVLTPSSLQRASRQGLKPDQIRDLLESASGRPLPAPLAKALDRWAHRGAEGKASQTLILKVRDESILEGLRRNRATGRYLGERIGSLEVRVSSQDWEALRAAAARAGILLDPPVPAEGF
jgi:hypothetical protein